MIVAVDCGSTNFKAAAFSPDGRRLAGAARPLPYVLRTNERAELAPAQVLECFRGLLSDLCEKLGVPCRQIRRMAFASQAQTFIMLNEQNEAVGPFIGWADLRAVEEAVELQEALGEAFPRECGSRAVGPAHMVSKVLWCRRHHEGTGSRRFVSLPSYLAIRLGAEHATDRNLAAMSGLYSIPQRDWWTEALGATGIAGSQLGRLVEAGEILRRGGSAPCEEFSADLEVTLAGNDHTAAAVACRCEAGCTTLTLGTAGVIYRHAGTQLGPYPNGGMWGPYPEGGYYQLQVLPHACSALDWADEALHGKVDSIRFSKLAEHADIHEDSVLFYPGAWGSMEAWVGRGTVPEKAYAVMEGIGFALRKLGGSDFSAPSDRIEVLGGGSKLDAWVQIVADIFQRPLVRPVHDGLDGAAKLAGVSVSEEGRSARTDVFQPDERKRDVLEHRYRQWNASSPALPD